MIRLVRFGSAAVLLVCGGGSAHAENNLVEEQRISTAAAAMPLVLSRYREVVDTASSAEDSGRSGTALWKRAAADVQGGNLDDRALYWARLQVREALHSAERHPLHLRSFELASRGFDDVHYPEEQELRVLITGFDPFLLDRDVRQSNPSGLAALALDGVRLETERGLARVETVIFPVRFDDFDAGLVEEFLEPWLQLVPGKRPLDLLVTVSMGRDAFDLERFPGRRRSALSPDNRNRLTGASATEPLVPNLGAGLLEGPEFVEFSLPVAAMLERQTPWPVRDNRQVVSLERGVLTPAVLGELVADTSVQGSGGGYLSNEISYRSVRLAQRLGAQVLIGHLHTPSVVGLNAVLESKMVEQIRQLLIAGLEAELHADPGARVRCGGLSPGAQND